MKLNILTENTESMSKIMDDLRIMATDAITNFVQDPNNIINFDRIPRIGFVIVFDFYSNYKQIDTSILRTRYDTGISSNDHLIITKNLIPILKDRLVQYIVNCNSFKDGWGNLLEPEKFTFEKSYGHFTGHTLYYTGALLFANHHEN